MACSGSHCRGQCQGPFLLSPTLSNGHLASWGFLLAKQGLWQLRERRALATCFTPTN